MEQQKIFKSRYVENLLKRVQDNTYIDKFKNDEFVFNGEKDTLLLPHIEKPLGLLKKMNPDKNKDLESAIALYEAFDKLTLLEASDPRLWTYLSLVDLYPYMLKRWPGAYNGTADNPKGYILEHYLLSSSSSLLRNQLSGLWFSVNQSIDKDRENPYELTEVLFWNQTLRTRTMGIYLLARYKEAAIGFLEYCLERGKENFASFEKEHQELTEYLNLVGGTRPITCFDRTQIKNILSERFPIPSMTDVTLEGELFDSDNELFSAQ